MFGPAWDARPRITADAATAPLRCACGGLSRRGLLGGAAAFGALAAGLGRSKAQTAAASSPRIDVHAHISPPFYVQEMMKTGVMSPPAINWTVGKHLEEMDKAGIDHSILSISTPGVFLGDVAQGRRLARELNDYSAKLHQEHPKLGMFATIPLPDTEGSLKEIAYGLDELKADGICLLTSYGDKWLGDPAFDPVFAELNRRKAVVYTHPTGNACCTDLNLKELGNQDIEFGTDTTRAIAHWVYTGSAKKFPDIKIIWSHAGGTMPFLIERFDFRDGLPPFKGQTVPLREQIKGFYYDTAQASNATAIGALRSLIPVSQILYGSDYPYRLMTQQAQGLADTKLFSPDELKAVYAGNAARLMPHYA